MIGYKNAPFKNKATITLYGAQKDQAVVFDNAIEAGNKVISNVGNITMFGTQRKQVVTRLLAPADKGATTIKVDLGLDWVVEDRVALAPTGYHSHASEDAIVSTYNAATGYATLTKPLRFYHWGAPESTASKFNGVDMRGEVALLTRNIKIQGENIEQWGCQIVTADTIEADLTLRTGKTIMDSVEIYNCSQIDT